MTEFEAFKSASDNVEYLGDSVYAGYSRISECILLVISDGVDIGSRIYLEKYVVESLFSYVKRLEVKED